MSPTGSSVSRLFGDRPIRRALPGYVATALVIVVTLLWTFWSVGELLYEGWWGPWVRSAGLPDTGWSLLVPDPDRVDLATCRWLADHLIGGAFTAWWLGPRLRSGLEIGQLLAKAAEAARSSVPYLQ